MPAIQLTEEQTNIVEHELRRGESLKVVAYAGTGKTFTLERYADRYGGPKNGVLYVAFNRSVQQEAAARFPKNVKPMTIHGVAFGAVGRKYEITERMSLFDVVKVSRAKNLLIAALFVETLGKWLASADEKISMEHVPETDLIRDKAKAMPVIFEACNKVWQAMLEKKLPMTHDGYLKIYQMAKPNMNYKLIMLDESQDTSASAIDLLQRQVREGASLVLVGDKNQQIYSWRGATNAMDKFCTETCYLTQSFRFGSGTADKANELLSAFYPMEKPVVGCPGVITTVSASGDMEPPYTMICRTNFGLFIHAVRLAEASARLCLTGGDTFQRFLNDVQDLYWMSIDRIDRVQNKFYRCFDSMDALRQFSEIRGDMDLMAKIMVVEKYEDDLPGYVELIRTCSAYTPDQADVCMITAHRSKGMEWDRVVLTDDYADLTDSLGKPLALAPVGADPEDGKTVPADEVNLIYVAMTRARERVRISDSVQRLFQRRPPAKIT